MTAITITDLSNAKLDVDHIAAIATSPALTATDRLGSAKRTIAGAGVAIDAAVADVDARKVTALAVDIPAAIASVSAINNRGAWAPATAYTAGYPATTKDIVLSGGTWYLCVIPHTSSAAFVTDEASKWRVYQGVVSSEIASPVTSKFATFGQALAAAAGGTLVVNSVVNIAADTTVYDDVILEVIRPGLFEIATGVTLTIQGLVKAGVHQIFAGDGSATVAQSLDTYPEWWGQVVSPTTPFPYRPSVPAESLRGADHEKFALALAKTLTFTDTPNFKLNARAKAAFAKGAVRISIVGDSISAGADNWRSNSYTALLKTKLKQTFPWVDFVFNNLAIGGMSAATLMSDTYVGAADRPSFVLSTNYWFPRNNGGTNTNDTYAPTGYALLDEDYWITGSVPGTTWKQHVVDSDPDVIVYAFGMNDGTSFDAFKANYEAFQTFIAAALPSSTPWFTLVSCFLPSKIPPNGQPHAAWQVPAQCMADQVKHFTKRDSYGLIDANAIFNLLRDGVRHDYAPYQHEANWRYGSDASKWTFGGALTFNGGAVRAEGTGMTLRAIATRDLDFSATFQITAFDGVYFVGRIGYRSVSLAPGVLSGYSADMVQNSASTVAIITVYYGSTVIANGSYDQGAAPVVGQASSLKVKVSGSRHEIWLNDIMVLDFDSEHSFYAGAVQVGIPQGAGYVLSPGLSYSGTYAETPSRVDKKWLLGTPIYDGAGVFQTYGDFISNLDSLGGNVVNHPTAWGHNTYYGFGIMKFVEELKQRVNEKISITKRGTTPFVVSAAANTPQLVSGIEAISIKLRAPMEVTISMSIPYSLVTPTSFPQIGIFVDGVWAGSSYIPLNADMGMVNVVISKTLAAGAHTIALGAVRNALTETYTVGHSGTEYSMCLAESMI